MLMLSRKMEFVDNFGLREPRWSCVLNPSSITDCEIETEHDLPIVSQWTCTFTSTFTLARASHKTLYHVLFSPLSASTHIFLEKISLWLPASTPHHLRSRSSLNRTDGPDIEAELHLQKEHSDFGYAWYLSWLLFPPFLSPSHQHHASSY